MFPLATFIDYMDDHSGAFTAILTAVLILVTIYYAIQNQRMVGEMRKSRELAILPSLALEFHRLGPNSMTLAIKNVGPGAALDIDVQMIYEPVAGGAAEREERRWRSNVMASGEAHDFMPPGELSNNLNTLTESFQAIRLRGTMKDAAGKQHTVDASFSDLPEWREVLGGAHQRWVDEPERRMAKAFADKFKGLMGR
jgi:hypothetical protein